MKRSSVLVIRRNGRFSQFLRNEGFDVVDLELIRTEPLADLGEAETVISRIDEYDGLFFTSKTAAEIVGDLLQKRRPHYAGKIYVLGERGKVILESLGFDVVYHETANTAADFIESFNDSEFTGKHLLFVRGESSLRTIPKMLADRAKVDELAVYRTVTIDPDLSEKAVVQQRLNGGDIETVCFFSPSGVEQFVKLFSVESPGSVTAAAIGETTAASAREAGLNVGFVSSSTNAEIFARDLAKHIKNIE
jgi:uroporphyrinogen-III synthase